MDLPDEDVVVAKFLKGLFEKALEIARSLDAWHDGLRPAVTITYIPNILVSRRAQCVPVCCSNRGNFQSCLSYVSCSLCH